ncbi:MAG: hypothetical protein PHD48_11325 [Alphaproteobacteria bacterium]|nr:hypothetical protein [Alphaproteobacteria bacterium]
MIVVDVLSQDPDAGFASCQKMAVAIAATMKSKGKCKPEDLLDRRFSHEEIKRCWDVAHCFARFDLTEA